MLSLVRPKPSASRKQNNVETKLVDVAGRALPLTIRRDRRATRITLRIEPGGRSLKMTIPSRLARREVEAFLAKHQAWIRERLEKIPAGSTLQPGGKLLFKGVWHEIVHTGSLRGLTAAEMVDGKPVIIVSGLSEHLGRRLEQFLKKQAKIDLEARVALHQRMLPRKAKSITLRDTRSRWGSCSTQGNLSFSWRIVMAPPAVLDYLAAHEVAHLEEMNHGANFWALCRRLCPDMDASKVWLKEHGNQLHAVDFD